MSDQSRNGRPTTEASIVEKRRRLMPPPTDQDLGTESGDKRLGSASAGRLAKKNLFICEFHIAAMASSGFTYDANAARASESTPLRIADSVPPKRQPRHSHFRDFRGRNPEVVPLPETGG